MKVKVHKVSACDLALGGVDIYLAARRLSYLPALSLARQACSEEERNFFAYIADMNLQREQQAYIRNERYELQVKVRKWEPIHPGCSALDAFILWMIGKMPGECYERIAIASGKEDWLYHPSLQGKECPSNGKRPGIECRCDECDTFLFCFPEHA